MGKIKRGEPYLPMDKEIIESMGLKRSSSYSNNVDRKTAEGILAILSNIDREDYISRYKLENLPDNLHLTSDEIYRMIYFKYSLAVAVYNDYCFVMPYALDGGIDVYGRFKSIKLFPYSSDTKDETGKDIPAYENKQLEQMLSSLTFKVIYCEEDLKDLKEGDLKAVIIKDYVSGVNTNGGIPRYQLNKSLVKLESIFIPYMRTNLKLSTGVKMVGVNDPSEVTDVINSLNRIDDAILSGVPFIPVLRRSEFQDIGNEPVAKVQDYFLAMQSVDNFRLTSMGLSNGGLFQKQERETISEQATNTVNANLRLQQNYEFQKKQWDLVNKVFGFNIKISIREDQNNHPENPMDKGEAKNKGFDNSQYNDIINQGGEE